MDGGLVWLRRNAQSRQRRAAAGRGPLQAPLAGRSAAPPELGGRAPAGMALAPSLSNASGACYGATCDAACEVCDHSAQRCLPRSCFSINVPARCHCPELSAETLIALGAVLLFLMLMLLSMAVWHWQRCGERRTTIDAESLLNASEAAAANAQCAIHPRPFGRTSIDSAVSCVVCMDVAINCVLMPCAHEVACLRCASRLGLCPVCRTAVSSILKVSAPDVAERERALLQQLALAQECESPEREPALPSPHTDTQQQHEQPRPPSGGEAVTTAESPVAMAAAEAAAGAAADCEAAGAEAVRDVPLKPKAELPTMLCLRCAKTPPNCVFLPCSHKVWCTECAAQVSARERAHGASSLLQPLSSSRVCACVARAQLPPVCPICNTGIQQGLRTFHKRL